EETAEATALAALASGRRIESPPPLLVLELLNSVAYVYCWAGRWQEAAPLVEEARVLTATMGDQPSRPAALALSLSAAIFKNLDGDLESAHRTYRDSLAIYRLLEGDVYPDVANIHNQLGVIEAERGRLDEALEEHGRALDVRRLLYPEGHWEIAQSLYQRGALQWRLGDLASAEATLHDAWSFYAEDPALGRGSGRAIFLWIQLAEVRLAQGRVEEAERMLDELTPEWWASRKPTSRLLSLAQRATGCVAAARGRFDEAEETLGQSLEALRRRHGDDAWQVQVAEGCLSRLR
ncbi:MAG: tetratricopeptide repeat protein, partial [Acidobacteriota bacterium]